MADNPDVSMIGWVDLFTDRVAEGIASLGLSEVAVEESIEAAVARWSPDFVVDAAVPEAHHRVTGHCLQRRVAVLGEKPMAANLEEAGDLVQLSERTSTLFVVSQNRRYNRGVAAFKALLAQHLGRSGTSMPSFTGLRTLVVFGRRWTARCSWIWLSIRSTPLAT